MKYKDLKDNSLFCPMPWIGAMVTPQGVFQSCCVQEEISMSESSLEHQSLSEVRKNSYWNNIRKDLIAGIKTPTCNNCWKDESQGIKSLRKVRIEEFSHYLNNYENIDIKEDGTLDNTIYHYDIRQTNLCNMKCIICNPVYSSLWNEESTKTKIAPQVSNNKNFEKYVIDANDVSKEDVFDSIKNLILESPELVNSFYFAGGEPIISDIHWQILDLLKDNSLFNVRLSYNTNLLKLKYKTKNIIDYWKLFDYVKVSASIDAVGRRAEYVRYGTKWDVIENNFSCLVSQLKKSAGVNITTSIFSVAAFGETLNWISNYDIDLKDIYYTNILRNPPWASVSILPLEIRYRILEKISKDLKEKQYQYQYKFIENELLRDIDITEEILLNRKKFKKNVSILDKHRNVNLLDYCPELEEFYNSILIE